MVRFPDVFLRVFFCASIFAGLEFDVPENPSTLFFHRSSYDRPAANGWNASIYCGGLCGISAVERARHCPGDDI
jgi:hypothetical protein